MRQIITIDEETCTGCGQCEIGCPEGALRVIDGKARLVGEVLCDGLGACIGTCPEGAISVETRDAAPYDEEQVMANVVAHGLNVIKAHLEHLRHHGQDAYMEVATRYLEVHGIPIPALDELGDPPADMAQGCPGSRTIELAPAGRGGEELAAAGTGALLAGTGQPELRNWPVQLKLVNPGAPCFDNADLVIVADCVPFAHPTFHADILRGKVLVMFCPKLDGNVDAYVQKLAKLFSTHEIRSITTAHMQVPCCFGMRGIVDDALALAGKTIPVSDLVVSIHGELVR